MNRSLHQWLFRTWESYQQVAFKNRLNFEFAVKLYVLLDTVLKTSEQSLAIMSS
jgi:hypothetical protein